MNIYFCIIILFIYTQLSSELGDFNDTVVDVLPNGSSSVDVSNTEDLATELQKQHQDYWQQSQYLSEKLTALQNEVADFKQEEKESSPLPLVRGVRGKERKSKTEVSTTQRIHASIVRQSSHKHYTYDKV